MNLQKDLDVLLDYQRTVIDALTFHSLIKYERIILRSAVSSYDSKESPKLIVKEVEYVLYPLGQGARLELNGMSNVDPWNCAGKFLYTSS